MLFFCTGSSPRRVYIGAIPLAVGLEHSDIAVIEGHAGSDQLGQTSWASCRAHRSLILHMHIKAACFVFEISHSMLVWVRRRN